MTVALISQYVGSARVVRPITEPALRAHAEEHDYHVLITTTPIGDQGKVLALTEALRRHDRAVWVDGDALITPRAPPVADWLDGHWCALIDDDRGLRQSWLWGLRRGADASWLLKQCDSPAMLDRDLLPRLLRYPHHPGVRGIPYDTGTSEAAGVRHHGYQAGTHDQRALVLPTRAPRPYVQP